MDLALMAMRKLKKDGKLEEFLTRLDGIPIPFKGV